jgi:pyocin large subunit-like protein
MDRLAKVFTRERSIADASIASSMKYLEKHDKTVAASLTNEETDFAARRDDICHDYVGESRHGFCETRLTQARAMLLTKRTETAKPAEKPKHKRHAKDSDN